MNKLMKLVLQNGKVILLVGIVSMFQVADAGARKRQSSEVNKHDAAMQEIRKNIAEQERLKKQKQDAIQSKTPIVIDSVCGIKFGSKIKHEDGFEPVVMPLEKKFRHFDRVEITPTILDKIGAIKLFGIGGTWKDDELVVEANRTKAIVEKKYKIKLTFEGKEDVPFTEEYVARKGVQTMIYEDPNWKIRLSFGGGMDVEYYLKFENKKLFSDDKTAYQKKKDSERPKALDSSEGEDAL